MCGLFGWQLKKGSFPKNKVRKDLAEVLTYYNDKRGGQSWGAWTQKTIFKGLGKAEPHHTKLHLNDMLFGHTRWATHGKVTTDNAHPFTYGTVTMAHNGVINNHSELNKKYERNYEVDSQHLLAHFVENKPFDEIKAYGAINWVDKTLKGQMMLGRLSDSGQLSVALTTNGVIWSSEKEAVDTAIEYAGLELVHFYDIQPGKVYYAEKGTLWESNVERSILVGTPEVTRTWQSYGSYEPYDYSGVATRGSWRSNGQGGWTLDSEKQDDLADWMKDWEGRESSVKKSTLAEVTGPSNDDVEPFAQPAEWPTHIMTWRTYCTEVKHRGHSMTVDGKLERWPNEPEVIHKMRTDAALIAAETYLHGFLHMTAREMMDMDDETLLMEAMNMGINYTEELDVFICN